jgi:hypothetical protein
MSEFMKSGGYAMWFILIFGLLALAAAGLFAARPDQRRIETVRALSRATLFSVLTGIVAGLAAVGAQVPARPEWADSPRIHLIVMQGISESLANGVLGFTILSLVWMVMAVGYRRLASSLPAGA